jgi:cytoskeleton protein RodZ
MALQRDRHMALFQRVRPPFLPDPPDDEPISASGPRLAGEVLRQRREELGLDLGEVAASLKIKPTYLAALEAGRPDRLPGPAYALGFVRAYGGHLGLDGDEILRRFKKESSGLDAKPDLSFPMPLGERSIPGGGMLLVALIMALCGYGTWYYLSTDQRSRLERVAEVPAALLVPKLEPSASEKTVVQVPEALTATRSNVPGGDTVKPPDTTNPEAGTAGTFSDAAEVSQRAPSPPLPAPAAPAGSPTGTASQAVAAPLPVVPAQSEGSRAYGVADGPTRIVIRATADSWIQVRGADQLVLFARILKTGESYRAPDQPGVSMRTGNAGGLEITVDGKPVPSIGPNGAVRNVPLEPQALISGTATRG